MFSLPSAAASMQLYSVRVEKQRSQEHLDVGPESENVSPTSQIDRESIPFTAGNPRVEHITGIVHLYRTAGRSHIADNSEASTSATAQVDTHSDTLCALAIPADMSVAAFCSFAGAYNSHMRDMRVLRRETAHKSVYMVIIRFVSSELADNFYSDYHNKPFSSLEPDVLCRLVYVRDVEITSGTLREAPAPPNSLELPTCPVCLERLDEEVSGVVMTVCNHRFHSECLQKWGDTSCPVCRYCMQSATSTSRCLQCKSTNDLWICLICGHVGCGRYCERHAFDHWQVSGHCYALELESQRVWDYAGDGYVHRLVQSKTDGKLVEVPSPASVPCTSSDPCGQRRASNGDEEVKEALMASKLDAITLEYNHLLATQLDSQRQYFEGLVDHSIAEAEQRCAEAQSAVEHAHAAMAAAQEAAKEADKKRQALDKKLADTNAKLAAVVAERDFLKQMSDSLVANQKDFQAQLDSAKAASAAKDKRVQELEEQVRDLMFFIEAQRTITDNGGELAGADLLPVPEQQPAARGGTRRRGKN